MLAFHKQFRRNLSRTRPRTLGKGVCGVPEYVFRSVPGSGFSAQLRYEVLYLVAGNTTKGPACVDCNRGDDRE